jgi:gliding motility-associated-like protein
MAGASVLSTIDFKYFINLSDAVNNNSNTISNTTNFTNISIDYQKIYVRLNSKINFDSETNRACFSILELELLVRPFPENKLLETPYIICVTNEDVVLNPAIIDTKLSMSDYSFIWYSSFDGTIGTEILGETNASYTTSIEGNYSVRITNTTNSSLCSSVFNFTTLKSVVPFSITANPGELIAFGTDNTFTAQVIPASNNFLYALDDSGWQTSPVFTNVSLGIHTLTVTDLYFCSQISTTVIVADYPKYFTPNGDGYNDIWKIGGATIFDSMSVYIFNRYGKLLKQIDPYESGWNGTFNGRLLPSDDYWFKIIYEKNQIKKEFMSHFTLKR